MNDDEQLLFMQIRILRMTSEKTGMSLNETSQLFKTFDVLNYIRECYGIFHTEGDEAVFEDVKSYMRAKGAKL